MNNANENSNITNDLVYKNRWFILAVLVMQPFMACLDSDSQCSSSNSSKRIRGNYGWN